MIEQKYTRLFETEHRPVETAAVIDDEGMALVFVKEGNETVVRPSTGAANEVFAGISMARNTPPSELPYVFEFTVEVGESVTLPRTPIAGQILVRLDGIAADVVAGTPATAGEVQSTDDELVFHADDAGKVATGQMMYEPTVTEARQYKGDTPVGGLSTIKQSIVGLIRRADVATTFFDASADFNGALKVNLGPNGKFTVGGSGTELANVVVVSAPSASNPFLVLNVR